LPSNLVEMIEKDLDFERSLKVLLKGWTCGHINARRKQYMFFILF
jgi:hypothetical protein